MLLSQGFIVCNKIEKLSRGECVNLSIRHFPPWILGSCMEAVTFKKPLIQKMKMAELQAGLYFPDAHLLLMADALLQGNEMSLLRII